MGRKGKGKGKGKSRSRGASGSGSGSTSVQQSSSSVVEQNGSSTTVTSRTTVVQESQDSDIRLMRVQEKHQLHSLNDRLQNFVLHSKAKDEENAELKRQLEELRARIKEQLQDVREEYSRETKKLRSSTTQLTGKNQGLESENARLQAQVRALELKIKTFEEQRRVNHELQDQVRDLTDEVESLKAKLRQRDDEIAQLREIIANHEEVIATKTEQLQEKETELDTVQKTAKKTAKHTESELADRVEERLMEAHKKWQFETKTQLTRLETELRQHFKSTVEELNARCSTLVRQNDRLSKENTRLAGEVDSAGGDQQDLLNRLAEQDRTHKRKLAELQRDLSRREEELTEAAKALYDKDSEFNDLMDVKISLQTEIEKYRSILDVEEARINTPDKKRSRRVFEVEEEEEEQNGSATTTVTTKRTSTRVTKRRRTSEGKKTKRSKSKKSKKRSSTRITNDSHTGPIRIGEVDLVSDCASVVNQTSEPMSLAGWKLISETGSQEFVFPDDFVLQPGKSVTIWSGRHAEKHHNPPEHLFWTRRYVWNNNGDTAILVNADGDHVSTVTGVPAAASTASSDIGSPAGLLTDSPVANPGRGAGAPVANGSEKKKKDDCVIM